MSSPARMFDQVRPFKLNPWCLNFYSGERLKAEVALLGSGFVGNVPEISLAEGCALLKASFGASKITTSPFQEFQKSLPDLQSAADSRFQYLLASDCPDAFLFWLLKRYLPSIGEISADRRIELLRRSALLLMTRFPQRPDLPYQVLMLEPTGCLLKWHQGYAAAQSVVFKGTFLSSSIAGGLGSGPLRANVVRKSQISGGWSSLSS